MRENSPAAPAPGKSLRRLALLIWRRVCHQGGSANRMRIHRRTDLSLDDLARWLNPIVSGWINY
jgi:hypothetical protein